MGTLARNCVAIEHLRTNCSVHTYIYIYHTARCYTLLAGSSTKGGKVTNKSSRLFVAKMMKSIVLVDGGGGGHVSTKSFSQYFSLSSRASRFCCCMQSAYLFGYPNLGSCRLSYLGPFASARNRLILLPTRPICAVDEWVRLFFPLRNRFIILHSRPTCPVVWSFLRCLLVV